MSWEWMSNGQYNTTALPIMVKERELKNVHYNIVKLGKDVLTVEDGEIA
jgi:hypothetical protein